MKPFFYTIGLAICFLTLAVSCDEGPPPALTSQQRELIDTLYLRQIQPFRTRLDSLCEANYSMNVQESVDSLLRVRREEEIRLRERALNQAPSRTQDSLNPQ